MRIIIYNPNSFGGNFQYIKELFSYLKKQAGVEQAILVLPANADYNEPGNDKLLKKDLVKTKVPVFRKIYFLYRTFANPLIFWNWLRKQPPSCVIFNDYDQWSSWFTGYFFKRLARKHKYGIILHDPDRDGYTPFLWLSRFTMKAVIGYMDVAFYHQFLPDKPYYKRNIPFINIPQGIYHTATSSVDEVFYNKIIAEKGEMKLLSIIGNIRDEKNYDLVIRALPDLPNVKLLVTGKPSSSGVPTETYRKTISDLGLEKRVIWEERYITDAEFSAAIVASDVLSVYYKKTFTSQSAVLNSIAPFLKPVVIADVASGMSILAKKYSVGAVIEPENREAFVLAVNELLTDKTDYSENWKRYIAYSSWANASKMIVAVFFELKQFTKSNSRIIAIK